ncbi:MAG: hypothetical protein IPK21_20520 [Haliscomenobacter sp.]|nr:hypothetical protein [Haliscomenobacter sp.]
MKTVPYSQGRLRRIGSAYGFLIVLAVLWPNSLFGQFQNHLLSRELDAGRSVVELNSQFILLQQVEFGRMNTDLVLSRLDATGKILPGGVRLGTEKGEFPRYVQKVTNKANKPDGFIIVGETNFAGANGTTDLFLIRTNQAGEALWARRYGNPATTETGVCVIQLPDKGFAAVGLSKEANKTGVYVVRTDYDGNPVWNRVFFDESGFAQGSFLEFLPNISRGGLYVVGTARMNSKNADVLVMNLDPAKGSVVWANRYWHGEAMSESGLCIRQVKMPKAPGLAITGTINGTDEFTFVVGSGGASVWGNRYAVPESRLNPVGVVPADAEGKNLLVGGTFLKGREKAAFYHRVNALNGAHDICQTYRWDTASIVLHDLKATFGDGFTSIGFYQGTNDTYVLHTNQTLMTPNNCPPQKIEVKVTAGVKQTAVKMTIQNRDASGWQVMQSKFEQKERRCY